jgi:hypothetical protein
MNTCFCCNIKILTLIPTTKLIKKARYVTSFRYNRGSEILQLTVAYLQVFLCNLAVTMLFITLYFVLVKLYELLKII